MPVFYSEETLKADGLFYLVSMPSPGRSRPSLVLSWQPQPPGLPPPPSPSTTNRHLR